MSEEQFLALAERSMQEAARAGRAGVRFQVPRTAPKYWEETAGLAAEFLRWLVAHQAQFEVMPAPLSFDWWLVDVDAGAFAPGLLASAGEGAR
jgi:hypothetical protein